MTEVLFDEGCIKVRDKKFYFADLVTAKQFRTLEELNVKFDKIEKDGLDNMSKEDELKLEREWQENVLKLGIKDETLESLSDKLSKGEIRDLVAQTYVFLERFGSIEEAKQYASLLKEIKKKGELPTPNSPTS